MIRGSSDFRFWTLIAGLLILSMPSFAKNVCGTPTQERQKEKAFPVTALEVLRAIKYGDSAAFLNHVSKYGIGFGVDVEQTPLITIKRDFRAKAGVYCLLFSTNCLPSIENEYWMKHDEVLSGWKISYYDWLQSNDLSNVDFEIIDDGGVDVCGADIIVHSKAIIASAPQTLELVFVFEGGKWMLDGTPITAP